MSLKKKTRAGGEDQGKRITRQSDKIDKTTELRAETMAVQKKNYEVNKSFGQLVAIGGAVELEDIRLVLIEQYKKHKEKLTKEKEKTTVSKSTENEVSDGDLSDASTVEADTILGI